MSKGNNKPQGVAQVYAEAILALAKEGDCCDAILEQLLGFVALMDKDPKFDAFLLSPEVDVDQRAAVIEKTMRGRASDIITNALLVINRKGRFGLIRSIVEAYQLALKALKNEVDVFVISAVPLTHELRGSLTEVASGYTGCTARLVESVDPDILGGLVLRIGDTQLNASLTSHLNRIRNTLTERGMREIHGEGEWAYVEGMNVE